MSIVRVKDNSELHRDAACSVHKVVDLVVNRDLTSLDRQGILLFPASLAQAPDLTGEQVVLKSKSNHNYQTGNLMGFMQVEDQQLVIESRFSPVGTDFFLHYMLEKVFEIPNLLDLAMDGGSGANIYELASFLFPSALKASLRKGMRLIQK